MVVCRLCLVLLLVCAAASPQRCPGVQDGSCRRACQAVICTALDHFTNATYNPTFSAWARHKGWTGSTADCIADSTPLPSFCSRYGIECCESADIKQGQCSIRGAVTGIVLEVNFLNGSISNPLLLSALGRLHACGLRKLVLQGNDLSGSLSEAWGDLTQLTHLNLGNNWISGTLPGSLRHLTKLQQLALGANFMSGPLPGWLGELQDLRELRLGANLGTGSNGSRGFYGTIPESLGHLTKLQVLDLQANSLTGHIPRHLCHPGSSLEMLQVRNNQLKGPLEPLTHCTALTQLDVSGNALSGGLAEVEPGKWSRLVVLDASQNQLTGSIPPGVYHLPVLAYLSLSHNRLSGSMRREVALLTYLTQLKLSYNHLSGSLEEGLWTLPQLQKADLSNNDFEGTISRLTGLTLSLQQLSLDNNSFGGPLPSELAFLRSLDSISLRNTNTSCIPLAQDTSGSNSSSGYPRHSTIGSAGEDTAGSSLVEGRSYRCAEAELLPCFLTFSAHQVPRTDETNMACPEVVRLPHDPAVTACSGSGSGQLGALAPGVAVTQTSDQSWDLDPDYYQYRKCACLKGYTASWSHKNTQLTCSPKQSSLSSTAIMAIAASAAGALLLAAVGLLVWLRLTVQLRPRWQREKELLANRKKGVPCGAPASIVVTDIERYSSMMKLNPQLTTRALGLHNAVMRRAAAAHAGHVIEQEGDSWSVAFHSPMDAVAFCLQVQQALAKTNWPDGLGSSNSSHGTAAATSPISSAARSRQHPRPSSTWSSTTHQTQQHVHTASAAGLGPHVLKLADSTANQQTHQLPAACCATNSISSVRSEHSALSSTSGLSSALCGSPCGKASLGKQPPATSCLHSPPNAVSRHGWPTPFSCLWQAAAEPVTDTAAAQQDSFCTASSDCNAGVAVPNGQSSNAGYGSKVSRCGSHSPRFWSFLSSAGADQAGSQKASGRRAQGADAAHGLNMRMGVASGFVPCNTHICRCALMQVAKAVSDVANGGQILLDSNTFEGVRDRLTELGTVDARGYNDKLWKAAAKAALLQHHKGLLGLCTGAVRCCGGSKKGAVLDTEVLALDMGSYYIESLTAVLPLASAPEPSELKPGTAAAAVDAAASVAQLEDAAVAAAALALEAGRHSPSADGSSPSSSSASACAAGDLRLYSVSPRSLQGWAKLFGTALNFKCFAQQTAFGYFQAPGTLTAQLGTPAHEKLSDPAPLPPVTMVFAEMEGSRALVRRKPGLARMVHTYLTRLLQVLLAALPAADGQPAGYLCREQECDMKFMLAFKEPCRALEWCLLVQEVLLYTPWPQEVLDEFGGSSSSSGADGNSSSHTSLDVLASAAASPPVSKDVDVGAGKGSCAGLGPCLRLGLAEGEPHSIMPDHLGRADYHGPHVNLAARLMGAAPPGQVATSIETAEHIFSMWRYEALERLNMQHSSSKQQEVSSRASEQPADTGGQPERAAATVSLSDQQQKQELSSGKLTYVAGRACPAPVISLAQFGGSLGCWWGSLL